MSSGSTIPRSRTDVPQEIDQVLSLLDPRTRGDIHQLFHNLRTATDGRSADIASSLRYSSRAFSETSTVLNELDTDSVALRQVVSAGDTTLSALARDPQALGGAVDQLAALLQATGRQQTALSDAIASAPAGLGAATTAFARLDRSVPPLTGLVADARPAFRELAHEAPNVQATLTAARPALAQAKGLVAQRSDVSQLGHLLDVALPTLQDLRPTLDAALPAIGEVRARFPDAFGFLANWDDFHSSYDAVGHAGRVGLIFAPTPTTSIGPNDVGSGELRPPFVRNPGTLAGVPWSNYASTVPKAKK
jgi:ABC-type transporter Mla subunit MlaD